MGKISSHLPLTACALAAALLISACGGGTATAPQVDIGSGGFAIDDYISGATVVCDANQNGASDAGELIATTDSTGFFKFDATCASPLVVTGGKNIDTQLDFVGKLKAPASSTVVTPLTTLMAEGMTGEMIARALSLPEDTNVMTLDPALKIGGVLVNPDLFRKTLVVQQVLQKTAETLAGLAGSTDVNAMYSQAAAAMAETLRGNDVVLVAADNSTSGATVSAVVQAAATRTKAPVKADTLGQVVATALAGQANQILRATNAQAISAATKTQQSSREISTFVVNNKGSMQEGASSDALTALAKELSKTVTGGGVTTPTEPPATLPGTALISWDEDPALATGIGAFGDGAPDVASAPTGGIGKAFKLDRSGGQNFGGAFFTVPEIPFAADRKTITARVRATRANAVIYLKVEAAPGVATEVSATVSAANTWQTLTWTLSGVNPTNRYKTMVFSADTDVAGLGAQTYWVDDISLAPAAEEETTSPNPPESATCATSTEQCISFSEATAGGHAFEGLISAAVITDPDQATNKLLKMVKGPSGQPWAGATVYTSQAEDGTKTIRTVPAIGLNTNKTVSLRAYSGAAVGTKVTLKLENSLAGAGSVFAEASTSKQNEWETLTFNFANPSRGSVVNNVSYDMASLFPAFSEIGGTQGALQSDTTFYFDELKYAISGSASSPPPSSDCGTNEPTCAPTTIVPSDAIAIFTETASDSNLDAFPNWGQATQFAETTIASNKSLKYSNLNYQGLQFSSVDVTAKGKLHLDLWTPNMTEVKISIISAGRENAVTKSLTTGEWNSVDIDLSQYTVPKLSEIFQIKLEATTAGGTLYVDNIYFWGASSGGVASNSTGIGDSNAEMGSGGPQTLPLAVSNDQHAFIAIGDGVFAGDYIGKLDANGNRAGWENASSNGIAKNGNIGYFQDALLSGASSQIVETGGNGWVTGNIDNPGGVGGFFRYFLLKAPSTTFADSYMGLYVNAPNNGTVDVSTYGNIKFKLWGPAEMYQNNNFDPTVQVILAGPKVAGCTATGSGGTEITKNLLANQKIGAGSSYTMSLAGWTVHGLCGTDTNSTAVNTVLSQLARVTVNVPGSSFNFTNSATGDSSLFATGVNLGPIAFIK